MTTTDAVLQLKIPPQPHLSRLVRERVMVFASRNGVEADDLANFLTALGEAVANAIEHARSNEPIRIECRLSADTLTATVEDSGIGFVRAAETLPDLPAPTAERGRGMALMQSCSDIFSVRSSPGRGTAVKVGRNLRRPLTHAPHRSANRRMTA